MKDAKRAVFFDFDGVLADSWGMHERAWQTVLAAYDTKLPEGVLVTSAGWASRDTAETIVTATGIDVEPKELALTKDEVFSKQAWTELRPMAGALDALKRLDSEYYIAVTAPRRKAAVADILQRYTMDSYVDVVVGVDDLDPKDELDMLFTLASKKLKVPLEKSVLVDDARNGILAAKRVGVKVVAFASNPNHTEDHSMADAQISSLDELVPELVSQVLAS